MTEPEDRLTIEASNCHLLSEVAPSPPREAACLVICIKALPTSLAHEGYSSDGPLALRPAASPYLLPVGCAVEADVHA